MDAEPEDTSERTPQERAVEEVEACLISVSDLMTMLTELAGRATLGPAKDLEAANYHLGQAGGILIEVRESIGQPDYPFWPEELETEDEGADA